MNLYIRMWNGGMCLCNWSGPQLLAVVEDFCFIDPSIFRILLLGVIYCCHA